MGSLISSMNFDDRSLTYNNEVAFVSRDQRLGAALGSLFLVDLHFADEIRQDVFGRRSQVPRVFDRAAVAGQ